MVSQLLISQKISLTINLCALVLILLLAGCAGAPTPPGSCGGGVKISSQDSTPPTLTLSVGQSSGLPVTVSASGSAQNMKLTSKTGTLFLVASAKDPESGIQALEIWVNTKTTFCVANGTCTTTGPGLLANPRFNSTQAQKKPGDCTPESSTMVEWLDLSKEIPQGSAATGNSFFMDLIINAVAVNHLGARVQTPWITATWSEP